MMLSADEVIKSDAEIAEDEAKSADDPPATDPEMEKIAMTLNVEQMKGQNAMELALLGRETDLIKLAAVSNQSLEELRAQSDTALAELYAKLDDKQKDRDSKERIFASESAMTERVGKGGGGYL